MHLPNLIVRYRLHYDVMRARRPAQDPVLTAQYRALRFNFVRQHHNCRVVTGGQYSSQMRAVSLNQLMIDVLWCGDPREKVTQTVTLSKLNGVMGLIMVWTEIPLDGRTDPYVFARGQITAAIHHNDTQEPLVTPYAGAIVDAFILMQDNACAHTARMSLTFHYDEGINVMNW